LFIIALAAAVEAHLKRKIVVEKDAICTDTHLQLLKNALLVLQKQPKMISHTTVLIAKQFSLKNKKTTF